MEPDPLQCPRCNSSNTKFCYYNNYSLSQPRHFCKACKRYWTRGGTLRNVPVGGGYRKNKKFKRHPPPTAAVGGGNRLSAAAATPLLNTSNRTRINNPFIHNLPTNFPLELNFPFSETRVSSDSPRFEDLLRKNHSGVDLSSFFRNGYEQNIEDRADFISFGSSGFAQHQRSNEFPNLMRYEDMEMVVGNEQTGKESNIIHSNQIEQININSSSFSWNSNNVGVWFDPSSSSLPSSSII